MNDSRLNAVTMLGLLLLLSAAGVSMLAKAGPGPERPQVEAASDCPPKACSIAFKTVRDGPPSVVVPVAATGLKGTSGRSEPGMVLTASAMLDRVLLR